MELIKITRQGVSRTTTFALFQCPFCGNIIEKSLKNGDRVQSCGCLVHHRKKNCGRKSIRKKPITKKSKAEARKFAVLHCPKYAECRDQAAHADWGGCQMQCYKCPDMEELKETNYWRAEINIDGCRTGYSEQTEHKMRVPI